MTQVNPQAEMARRYIEHTGVSVFLTGKAGTGKTTFLHQLDKTLAKRHVVVAPTGVAAINAGGVTIHSFFQLPFDPYLPDVKELITEYQLPQSHKSLSKAKLDIIRTLEVLIIDEVSMVRADLLDAIDFTLRHYRRSGRPFGGVQLVMIGDVHQLPPVVTDREKPFMDKVYPSPFFFNSKALQKVQYVTIELSIVYRQQDRQFVELLNNIRDNRVDSATLEALNCRVGEASPDAITLTSHNFQADAINSRHMEALRGESRQYEALISGNFPEGAAPVERHLTVKVGERVMFVKNDSSGQHHYYNGKLATVMGFNDEEEQIELVDDEGEVIFVGREEWENVRYNISPTNHEIKLEVEGTFRQFPLRAAWAVTIHKAQGLTFDKVNIDAASAFAFGQVYVALSRCRTLEGLTLVSTLNQAAVFGDRDVSHFLDAQPGFEQTSQALGGYEEAYYIEQLCDLFTVDGLLRECERLEERMNKVRNLFPKQVAKMSEIVATVVQLNSVAEKFCRQLTSIPSEQRSERIAKGAEYYDGVLKSLNEMSDEALDIEVDNKEIRKSIEEAAEALREKLGIKRACISVVCHKGYDVVEVQKAKTDYLLREQNSGKKRPVKRPNTTTSNGGDTVLQEELRRWRAQKAKEIDRPAYVVLQQKALHAIVEAVPTTIKELSTLVGVGQKTIERYGEEIINIVKENKSTNNANI